MQRGRFTLLVLALTRAGLLAASLAPCSISIAVTSCLEPAELALAAADAATPALAGDGAVAVDAIAGSEARIRAPGASRFMATPLAVSLTSCDPLGAHAGRAPPHA